MAIAGWATYLRVSDEDKQSPERSFALQRQGIKNNLLNASQVNVTKEYRDMLTGKDPHRLDYQKMLTDAKAGKYSHLGLYRADRFGRDAVEGLQAATSLISMGIKLRVANMPSLAPETPDGFFMFLIQMGLAQREVDVLALRTRDGMEAKLRAGGWVQKAPEGYVNKERQIKSGKYDRWVEPDPRISEGLKLAWELLLTNRYTLFQICEELSRQGYTRSAGRPWAWLTPKRNGQRHAANRLSEIFHNPFYAGWVHSKRFGIPEGEIRGNWEPLVSENDFRKGLNILLRRNKKKNRKSRNFYLLKDLLWVKVNKREVKLYGSTPTGRSGSYSYYVTHAKINGKALHFPCETVDSKIQKIIASITIAESHVPAIQHIYQEELLTNRNSGSQKEIAKLEKGLKNTQNREEKLLRLYLENELSETSYKKMRSELFEKQTLAKAQIVELTENASEKIDRLDRAIIVLSNLAIIYKRASQAERKQLLSLLMRKIIISKNGVILEIFLEAPFQYLRKVSKHFLGKSMQEQIYHDQSMSN